jgi:broad specificity phosphatase PhoE
LEKPEFKQEFDVHIASSMKRLQQGLKILFEMRPDVIDSIFNERSYGHHIGMPHNERGNADEQYHLDPYCYRPPGGESAQEVREKRVSAAKKSLNEDYAGKKVLIIGHGDWMRSYIADQFDMSREEFNNLFTRKDPLLTILNGQMIDFSHSDPVSGEMDYSAMWFRSVALTNLSLTDNRWIKVR